MSENITHTGVTDDCRRLLLHDGRVSTAFKEALADQHEIVRLGGITRHGAKFVEDLLDLYRDAWPGGDRRELLAQKIGFVLGWLFHRAADLQMKPVFRAADPDCPQSPTDCSVYHDVYVFRAVYGSGGAEPYPQESILRTPGEDVDRLEDLVRALLQRALIGLHTLIPDHEDVDGWLDRLIGLRQRWRVDVERYAQAFSDPDPDMVQRFIEDINFYDPADDIVRLARSVQEERPPDIALDDALESAAEGSHYAQALRRGVLYALAADRYFLGEIGPEQFRTDLEMSNPLQ